MTGTATATAPHRIDLKSVALERSDPLRATGTALVMWPNVWKAPGAFGTTDIFRSNHPMLDGPNIAKADLKEKSAKLYDARDP